MYMSRLFFILLFLSTFAQAQAGGDTLRIRVKVEDLDNPHIWMNFFAVNKRTGAGAFGDKFSEFDMLVLKTDTIVVRSKGYVPMQFCMKDSAATPFKLFTIKLFKEALLLPEATVIATRDLKEIEQDIKKLEIKKTSAYAPGYLKVESPITALYEAFSKVEREKRAVAQLEFEDQKRAILRELLAKYVQGEIFILSESEFDDFITYCDPDLNMLKTMSQYDLIMWFKQRYLEYDRYVRKKN
jgi:hypothetical protein